MTVGEVVQEAAEFRLAQQLGLGAQLLGIDEALAEGDFLGLAHQHALAGLDGLHEGRGLHQAVRRAGIKPGGAAAEPLDMQRALFQVELVEVGDLKLAARAKAGWLAANCVTRLS